MLAFTPNDKHYAVSAEAIAHVSTINSVAAGMRFWFALATCLFAIPFPFLAAHEGHDHEAAQPAQALQPSDHQRIVARSNAFDMVTVSQGHEITIYLDRSDSNEPVAGATVTVEGEGHKAAAKQTEAGTYVADADWIESAGAHSLTITVTSGHDTQQFTGTLGAAATAPARGSSLWVRGVALAGLGFGIALAAFRPGRQRWGGIALSLAMLAVLMASTAMGHDVEPASAPPAGGAVPHRHANGSVFLSKPTQHLVGIRTVVAVESEAAPSVEIAGRVIVDPNRSGRAQAVRDGSIEAGPKGFPHLGQAVTQGEVLAYLVPTLTSAEEATLKQTLAQIERDMALLVPRTDAIATINPNMPMGEATASALQELQIQSQSLTRQKEIVTAALNQRIEIKAPIAGVISAALVNIGQVVAPRDPLFEIVDPGAAWVEAWSFDPVPAAGVSTATALTESGHMLHLSFVGRGPVLRQQATPVVFRIADDASNVEFGTPLRIFLDDTHKAKGVVLPAAAVERGAGAVPIVWEHSAPETFIAHPVKVTPLDAERVIVTGDVKAGMHLVVAGANAISQVR
jgi:cobalt-zinc-cadmium efflux system membrane fusion protein